MFLQLFVLILAQIITYHCVSIAGHENVTLTILHTNDVHSRFRQTNRYGGPCSSDSESKRQCYGGFARLHHKVNEMRRAFGDENVLYLSGGDYYQGTVWYTLYKWKVVSHFVNKLNHTAMAFGNHEFDDKIDGILPFLEAATFPVLSSNIDASAEPRMEGKFKGSVVVEAGGRKVGIIGYVTEDTRQISYPERLIFKDVVASVKEEAERLGSSGVKTLIALGHAGYELDQKIAREVPQISLVVGGHTNTFLYNGTPPDSDVPKGDYPTVITQEGGKQVPVVQAYAFGKYLGYLNITLNEEGEVVGWSGNPILLDHTVPQDPEMLEEVEKWGENITILTKGEVGKTLVFLNGSEQECRLRECNLGNLIADGLVQSLNQIHWYDVVAIMNGGGIRSSIDETSANGTITLDDVLTVLPFRNTIDLIEIKGRHLRELFEYSVVDYDPKGNRLPGKFLQVSGIKVTFDITKPNGARVREMLVKSFENRVPSYRPLENDKMYKVALPSFIAEGGDGYGMIKEYAVDHKLEIAATDSLVKIIKSLSPITQGVEGRIIFDNGGPGDKSSSGSVRGSSVGLIITQIKLLLAFVKIFLN